MKLSSSKKTIFLTGASGVLGQALLQKLSDHTLICLVHRAPVVAPNVISLRGDVAQPRFGLGLDEFNYLAQRVDCIVHAAAVTDLSKSDQIILRTNRDGTRYVLELAEAARADVLHISTAFVHQSKQTVDGDDAYAYVYSKREAERLVQESGLPHTIIRPSIITGDSQTGAIAKFQGFHLVTGFILTGLLPVLPVWPQGSIDFVPQDLVGNVVAELINQTRIGGEWWLTLGGQALSVRTIVDLCLEHSNRLIGYPILPPKVVDADVFERLIRPVFLPVLPLRLQKTLIRALKLIELARMVQPLPTSLPDVESQLGLALTTSAEQVFLHHLEYWVAREGHAMKQVASRQIEASKRGG